MNSIHDFLQQRQNTAGNYVLPAVKQLAVPDESGNGMLAAGSAVLIWYRGYRYLLTAAHVVNFYPDCSFYVGTNTKWVDIGRKFMMPRTSSDQDLFDFAFHRISDAEASEMDGCTFLTANQVVTRDEPVFASPMRSKYFALGYPLNRFKMNRPQKSTTQKTILYTGAVASPEQHRLAKRDPRQHIVLEYNSRAVVGPQGIQRSPKLSGLSGGGVFTLPGVRKPGDLKLPQLAGLTIEQTPEHRVMIGIRIEVVCSAIDEALASGFDV